MSPATPWNTSDASCARDECLTRAAPGGHGYAWSIFHDARRRPLLEAYLRRMIPLPTPGPSRAGGRGDAIMATRIPRRTEWHQVDGRWARSLGERGTRVRLF